MVASHLMQQVFEEENNDLNSVCLSVVHPWWSFKRKGNPAGLLIQVQVKGLAIKTAAERGSSGDQWKACNYNYDELNDVIITMVFSGESDYIVASNSCQHILLYRHCINTPPPLMCSDWWQDSQCWNLFNIIGIHEAQTFMDVKCLYHCIHVLDLD